MATYDQGKQEGFCKNNGSYAGLPEGGNGATAECLSNSKLSGSPQSLKSGLVEKQAPLAFGVWTTLEAKSRGGHEINGERVGGIERERRKRVVDLENIMGLRGKGYQEKGRILVGFAEDFYWERPVEKETTNKPAGVLEELRYQHHTLRTTGKRTSP